MNCTLKATALIAVAALAGAGCSKKSSDTTTTTAAPMTISGSLAASGNSGRIGAARAKAENGHIAPTLGYIGNAAVSMTDLLISCVTFAVPPEAGTGGNVQASGKFTVQFSAAAKGKNFGCFVTSVSNTFDPIPVTFVDTTKKSMDGSSQQKSRIAANDSIKIPALNLDLDKMAATVDQSTITTDAGASASSVLATATGTKVDFTGEYTIVDPATAGVTLPSGYSPVCTVEQAMASQDHGCGPVVGMHIYLQRYAGKRYVPTDANACQTAIQAHNQTSTQLLAGSCAGSTATEDAYAISIWTAEMDHPQSASDITNALGQDTFNACGRKLGFTADDAKVMGGVDLTSDPNYVASGSSSTSNGKYYDGLFSFATSAIVDNSLVGNASSGKPFHAASNNISEGWKFDQAQLMWSQGDCQTVMLQIGERNYPVWRCNGNYSASHNANPAGTVNAYQDGFGRGCYNTADNKPVQFDNWSDMWTSDNTVQCENLTTIDGNALPTGYNGNKCQKANFVPKQNGTAISSAITVACENINGLFNSDGTPINTMTQGFDWQHDFAQSSAGAQGTLCSALSTSTEKQKLMQLQCYANAYWQGRSALSGCTRELRTDWAAQTAAEFIHQDGPAKAKGQVIMELLNYTANDSATFTTVEMDGRSIQIQGQNGGTWVNCRVRDNQSITLSAVPGKTNQFLADMTSVRTLVDVGNKACVAEAAKSGSQLQVGTEKTMFILQK